MKYSLLVKLFLFIILLFLSNKAITQINLSTEPYVCAGQTVTYDLSNYPYTWTGSPCDARSELFFSGCQIISLDWGNKLTVKWNVNFVSGYIEIQTNHDPYDCYPEFYKFNFYETRLDNISLIVNPDNVTTYPADELISADATLHGLNTNRFSNNQFYWEIVDIDNQLIVAIGTTPLDIQSSPYDLQFRPSDFPELRPYYDEQNVKLRVSFDGCVQGEAPTPYPFLISSPAPSIINRQVVDESCFNAEDGEFIINSVSWDGSTFNELNPMQKNIEYYIITNTATGLFKDYITVNTFPVKFNDIPPGDYQVTASILDNGGEPVVSSNPVTFTINPANKITVGSQVTEEISCNGESGTITSTATGGLSVLLFSIDNLNWNNATSTEGNNYIYTKSGLTGGTHTIYIKDANDCPNSTSSTLTNPPPITTNGEPIAPEPTKCSTSDGSITLTALGGTLSSGNTYNYLLENIDEFNLEDGVACTFPNLLGGTYNIKITDENGCFKNFEIEVPLPNNNLSASTNNIISSKCNEPNGSATVSVSGGTSPFSYQWDDNGETTATALNLTNAIHTVTVKDALDCEFLIENINIDGTLVPQIESVNVTSADCSYSEGGGSLTVSFTNTEAGDYSLEWYNANNESVTPDNLAPGFYSVTLIDALGCDYTFSNETLEVTAPEELRANLIAYENPVCDNDHTGVLTVEAVGGTPNYTYNWIDFPELGNVNTISNLYSGTYKLKIIDDLNCVTLKSFDLFNTDNVNIEIVDSVFLCQGQTATLDAGNLGSVYDWTSNNGFSATSQSVVLQNEGDYSVTVTNENGCTGQKEFHVKYDDRLFEVAFLISTESTIEDTLVLIEISWPVPDSVQWIIPDEFTRLVDGVSYKELIPSQLGDYTIGMKAFLGGCNGIVEKQITILSADSLPEQKDFSQVLIRKVNLFPNPNNGIFEIDIELATETNIQVDLYSMDGMKMQAPRIEKGLKNYNVKYNLMSLEPGFYFINVIAGKEVKKLKFIVN